MKGIIIIGISITAVFIILVVVGVLSWWMLAFPAFIIAVFIYLAKVQAKTEE